MNQVYPNAGLVLFLQRMALGDFHFHLYANNYTPVKGSTLLNFTEAPWLGYVDIAVAAAAFTLYGVAGNVGSLLAAPIAFVNTSGAPQSAYGYYVTDTSDTILLAAAIFDASPISQNNGDSWLVTPVLGDFSQFG